MIKIILQSLYGNGLTSSSYKDTFPPLIAICQTVNSQCELFQWVLPFAQYSLAVCNPLVIIIITSVMTADHIKKLFTFINIHVLV